MATSFDPALPRFAACIVLVALAFQPGAAAGEALRPSVSSAYETERGVPYRDSAVLGSDEYAAGRCRLDWYHPVEAKGFATVVWFHGGALRHGERFIPEALKEKGIAVAAASYRLSPQVNAPAYIEDAAAAVAWVFARVADYGGDPRRIFVSGHSAGGYLVSMVGLDKQWLGAHGIDADDIAGLIPFSGQVTTHSTIRSERGLPEDLPIIDAFAPLSHARTDAPAMLLITGDRDLDLIGRYEENAYFVRIMQAQEHRRTSLFELQGFDHGTMVDPACHLLIQHVLNYVPPAIGTVLP